MSGPTYISNPSLWEQFRHTGEGENFIPVIRRNTQKGGGILNRRKAYMIPLKSHTPQQSIQLVTPVAADRERALSDLKETIRNDEPHMPVQKSIKKRKTKKSNSRVTASRGRGRAQRKKNKARAQSKGIKKPSRLTKKKATQRKSRLLRKNIFEQWRS